MGRDPDGWDGFEVSAKIMREITAQNRLDKSHRKSRAMDGCDRCDECGGAKTYANQACLPIRGKVRCIDWCIHQIVAALNAGGVDTVASCCGHGAQDGRIDLADGRVLILPKGNLALEDVNA